MCGGGGGDRGRDKDKTAPAHIQVIAGKNTRPSRFSVLQATESWAGPWNEAMIRSFFPVCTTSVYACIYCFFNLC